MNQDYEDVIQVIYNNSDVEQRLNKHVGSNIILINNCWDLITKKAYENVGAIFRDALTFIPDDIEAVTFFDDDDIFLPNHVSEGVKGLKKAFSVGKKAYKPYNSYYKDSRGIHKVHNTLEPSVFIDLTYLHLKGFRPTVVDYHQGWYDQAIKEDMMLVDKDGTPTFIYDWSGQMGVFKISGGKNDSRNLYNHGVNSADHGDHIVTPISTKEAEKYYEQLNTR
jgi:hypothetical protein